MNTRDCRGTCKREPYFAKSRQHSKPGLALCRNCQRAIRVRGRPRDCPCCGQWLSYRCRRPKK